MGARRQRAAGNLGRRVQSLPQGERTRKRLQKGEGKWMEGSQSVLFPPQVILRDPALVTLQLIRNCILTQLDL